MNLQCYIPSGLHRSEEWISQENIFTIMKPQNAGM